MNHTTPRLRMTRKVMMWCLLFFGYSVIAQTQNDLYEAFMNAACIGGIETLEQLLDKDIDIDIQDNYGWTALMLAESQGHTKVAELLKPYNVK